jgi:hypothetical protein
MLGIQSCYFAYIVSTKPHIDSYFNVLDLFNESMTIITVYSLIGFSATSLLDPNAQWILGYLTAAVITIVFLVNLTLMIVIAPGKVIRFLKRRKIRKAREAHMKSKKIKKQFTPMQESMKQLALEVISEESESPERKPQESVSQS